MDNRPIGFFDSGLGGLTAIPYLMEQFPNERIIYFGDTARTPYGSKAENTIKQFSLEIADFLVTKGVKMIVIACNTVTATCLPLLRAKYPEIPVVGIIGPAASRVAKSCTRENRVGIIGTKATIENGAYESLILSENPELHLYSTACPLFVPMIEEGFIHHEIVTLSVKHYLDDFIRENELDTLVLGCTHYPLIRKSIEELYPHLNIIDPSQEILKEIKTRLEERNLLAEGPKAENIFYASDLSENFLNMINTIFKDTKYRVAFKNLEL